MDIALVSMPYAAIERPSIAIGLLTAELRGAGIEVGTHYACLDFAARLGAGIYDCVLNSHTTLFIGEWTFAAAAFPEMSGAADDEYLSACAEKLMETRAWRSGVDPKRLLLALRQEAAQFTSDLADEIVARRPRIVGCSSTFQQHTASLALLRAIRERDPDIITVLGGTNCESTMGMATRRAAPWVDYVFSGEADEVIVPFVRSLLDHGRNIVLPPGVIDHEVAHRREEPPRASVWSVDAIPTPDYDDYFDALERSPLRDAVVPALVVETSRGCWWGAKSHCTFCGLNGGNMSYRAKSPARAVEEFHRLAARYGVRRFTVVDNIMDVRYHQSVLPQLAGHGYDIFYETKANLRRQHMQGFTDAGVRSIQPGMESFHDEILTLLAKGNKAWMNVQLLKWATELAMEISWVFLIDVPEQRDEWYLEMLSWLPAIAHYPPPVYATPIQFIRFSPYHRDAEKYGFDLIPQPAYAYVYPLPPEEMEELAYYFVDRNRLPGAGIGQRLVVAWLGIWRDLHDENNAPVLTMRRDGGTIVIEDTRSCRTAKRRRLKGLAARVYMECDEAVDRNALRDRLGVSEEELEKAVTPLLEANLLLELGGRLLALAVDVSRPRPTEVPNPGGRVVFQGAYTL